MTLPKQVSHSADHFLMHFVAAATIKSDAKRNIFDSAQNVGYKTNTNQA